LVENSFLVGIRITTKALNRLITKSESQESYDSENKIKEIITELEQEK